MKKLFVLAMAVSFIFVYVNCSSNTKPEKVGQIIGDGGIYNLAEEKLGGFVNKQQFVDLLINRYLNDDLKKLIDKNDEISNKIITFILLDPRKGHENRNDLKKNIISMCKNEKFTLNFYEERNNETLAFHRKSENSKNLKTLKRLRGKHIHKLTNKSKDSQILAIHMYIPQKKIVSIQIYANEYRGKGKWRWNWWSFYTNDEFEDIYTSSESATQLNKRWSIYVKKDNAIQSFLNEYLSIFKNFKNNIADSKSYDDSFNCYSIIYNDAKNITKKLIELRMEWPEIKMEFSNLWDLDNIPKKYSDKTKKILDELEHQIKLLRKKKGKELYKKHKSSDDPKSQSERAEKLETISKKIKLLFKQTNKTLKQEKIKQEKLKQKKIEQEKKKWKKLEQERVKSCSTPEYLGKYIITVTDKYIQSLKKVTSKKELISIMKEYAIGMLYIKGKGNALLKKNLNLANELKNSEISKKVMMSIKNMDYAYIHMKKEIMKYMTDSEIQKISQDMNNAEDIIKIYGIKNIKTDTSLFRFVQEDTPAYININVKELSKFDIFKELEELYNSSKTFKNYHVFFNKTGIDPKRDINRVILGLYGLSFVNNNNINFSIVINLKYDKKSLLNIINIENEIFKEEAYGGAIFYSIEENEKVTSIAFPDNNHIIIASTPIIKKTMDLFNGKEKSVLMNNRQKSYIKMLNSEALCLFIYNIPEQFKIKKTLGMGEVDFTKAECFLGSIMRARNSFEADLKLISENKEGNKQIVQLLNMFKMMGAQQPDYSDFINGIKINSDKNMININSSISDSYIQKIKDKIKK